MQWTLMHWKYSILFEEIAVATCAEEKVGPDNFQSRVRTFHESLHSVSSYVNRLVNPQSSSSSCRRLSLLWGYVIFISSHC